MDISNIFERVLLRSGQFVMRRNNIEIDIDSFRILVEDALAIYSKAYPFTKEYEREIIYPRSITLDENFDLEMGRAVDWVSEVTPMRFLGNAYSLNLTAGGVPLDTELVEPVNAPWVFNKQTKVLTIPYSAWYRITACYYHQITSKFDEHTGETIYEVNTITPNDQVFFQLLQGMFLQGIGKSRRAFTLNDLPIIMDASEMASEGKDLVDDAMENIKNIQKFYLAMG